MGKEDAIDTELVETTRSALYEIVSSELYARDFSQEDYEALLKQLEERCPDKDLENRRGAIKQGIIEFFADSFQEIEISIIEGRVRIVKPFVYPAKGEAFDRLVHELYLDLLSLIEDEETYRRAAFMWIFPDAIREALFSRFDALSEAAARTVVRQGIEKIFELDGKDIILFLRSRIFIRTYQPPRPLAEGAERRFAGEDPAEMEAMFDAYFPEGASEFIEDYLPEILEERLNFTQIDNHTFNRNYIQVFRSMIEIIVVEAAGTSFPEEKVEGFTGYVLRRYFDEILLRTATELMRHVEARDRNAEKFVKYYKDEVVIDPADGRKIQKYAIIDDSNQAWHYSAILAVLLQHTQAKKRVQQQEEKLIAIKSRIADVEREAAYENRERRRLEEKSRDINETVSIQKSAYERTGKISDAISHAQQAKAYSDLLDRQKIAKEEAVYAQRRYRNRLTELENWKKQLTMQEKVLDEIHQQNAGIVKTIAQITRALAVVFAKR